MFAQELIVFSPQVGGGVGAGSLCAECPGTGHWENPKGMAPAGPDI